VLSPSSAAFDRGPKADLYARVGMEFLWLVDPQERFIEAFRIERGAWLRLGAFIGEASARIPPFDAVELELGLFWVGKKPTASER
jgi:hypothetical protein